MTDRLSIALAQINPTAGNLPANTARIRAARAEAAARGADLVVFPALSLSGAPLFDLLRQPFVWDAVERAVRDLAADTVDGGPALLVGAPWRDGDRCHNAALLLDGGRIAAVRFQAESMPVDGDDRFDSGPMPGPINVRGVRIGVPLGADLATADVVETLAESGAELLVAPIADAFAVGSHESRVQQAVRRVVDGGLPLLAVNLVGGQDERVFEGGSFALATGGRLVAQAPLFAEHLLLTRWDRGADDAWTCSDAETIPPLEGLEAIYAALVLGLHDAVTKAHRPGALVELTGRPESALVAALAVDALGADRVLAIRTAMPAGPAGGPADDALEVAADCGETADLLGCRLDGMALAPVLKAFGSLLAPAFAGQDADEATENLRARVRGSALAALAERTGAMLLATADRTDRAVGAGALGAFAESAAGYAVLADVAKTTVLALARWRNTHQPAGARGPAGRVVPERVLERGNAPAHGAGLPPLDALDDLVDSLLGGAHGVAELCDRGHDAAAVTAVWRALLRSEDARRRAPVGPGVTRGPTGGRGRFPLGGGFTDPS